MSYIDLIATASFGIESVVARELHALGYTDTSTDTGRVHFKADEKAIAVTNVHLRSADRVLLRVGSFHATTFDELFEGTKALDWTAWLPENAEFPVTGKSVHSTLFSVPDCQAIVKKAIVEKMKSKYRRQWFAEDGPKYRVEVSLLKDEATLTIDTSGAGLHKRGYRPLTATAPLRETLAAAMIQLSVWNAQRTLWDPFCGSGTIPIEAALLATNTAPGLNRKFAAEEWHRVPKSLWNKVREEARALVITDPQPLLQIIGTDIDPEVLSMARYHARLAGLEGKIHFQQADVADMKSSRKYGVVICNPPYGERLGEQQEAEELYRVMKQRFQALDTWSFYVLTSHPRFEWIFGRKAERRRKLYNGKIECQYYQYLGPRPPRPSSAAE